MLQAFKSTYFLLQNIDDDVPNQVQKSTAYTWLDCCCFNAAQIVLTPPAPRNGAPNNQGGVGRQQQQRS